MDGFDIGSFDISSLFFFCLCLWGCFKAGLIQSFVSLIGWFIVIFVGSRLAIHFFPEFRGFFEVIGMLDIVILLFVCIGIWRGFNVGLIQSLVSLVGWFLAVFLGSKLAIYIGPPLSIFFENTLLQDSSVLRDNPVLQIALGFLIIVLVIFTLIQIVAHVLKKIVKTLQLSLVDKISGGFLGGIRNILIILAVFNLTAPMVVTLPFWQKSILAPELMIHAPLAQRMIQETFGQAWEQFNYQL